MDYGIILKKQRHTDIHIENVDHLTNEEREILLSEGWLEVIYENEYPSIEDNEYYEINKAIELKDGYISGKYIIGTNFAKCEKEIIFLKEELSNSDYKVIKNMEAQSCGLEPPYNPIDLHNERQALRDKINYLNELLAYSPT